MVRGGEGEMFCILLRLSKKVQITKLTPYKFPRPRFFNYP
jgi:hypothetical protein